MLSFMFKYLTQQGVYPFYRYPGCIVITFYFWRVFSLFRKYFFLLPRILLVMSSPILRKRPFRLRVVLAQIAFLHLWLNKTKIYWNIKIGHGSGFEAQFAPWLSDYPESRFGRPGRPASVRHAKLLCRRTRPAATLKSKLIQRDVYISEFVYYYDIKKGNTCKKKAYVDLEKTKKERKNSPYAEKELKLRRGKEKFVCYANNNSIIGM